MQLSPSKLTIGLASICALGSLVTSVMFSNATAAGPPAGQPPIFVPPSPCNEVILATPGVQMCFNIVATDPEGEDIIIQWNNIPYVGSYTIPPTVFQSNGPIAQLLFCYTPTQADVGQQFNVIFVASNPDSQQVADVSKCYITILVEASLSAELELFTGKVVNAGGPIEIDWTTSSEIDNAYFNIYRSQSAFENAIQLNTEPIVAMGSPISGAHYSKIDRRVTPGTSYKYWLESVDIYGETQLFGPISVTAR